MHETELIGLALRWPLKIKNKAIVRVCVEFCENISFTSWSGACDQAFEAYAWWLFTKNVKHK